MAAGKIQLALEVFEALEPKRDREKLIKNFIAVILEQNAPGCEKEVLRLKGLIGEELTQVEADGIIYPYITEKNNSRRGCREISLDVVRAASKKTVMSLFEIALKEKTFGGDKFVENIYYILKQKL